LNENLTKMRGKINEFFDKLEFTNDVEGKKVAVITTDDIQRLFEELNESRHQNLKDTIRSMQGSI